jgi:hypothetical protein
MNKLFITTVSLVVLAIQSAIACDMHGKTGFLPDNDLWIGTRDKNAGSMTEKDFSETIDKVASVYAPIITATGMKFRIVKHWIDGTVNAYAKQSIPGTWEINMFGGFARHKLVDADSFAMVICHEIGHHIGGAPKKVDRTGVKFRWATNEGQADYWASLKCFRKYVTSEKRSQVKLVAERKLETTLEPRAKELCAKAWPNEEDYAICLRSAAAGKKLGMVLASLRGTGRISFATPDTSKVRTTYHQHPQAQCRLDTYIAGALCEVSEYVDVDQEDLEIGNCTELQGHTQGLRPKCWYNKADLGLRKPLRGYFTSKNM